MCAMQTKLRIPSKRVVCFYDRPAASCCFVRKIHKHGIGKELAARALTQTFISFNNRQYCDKNINSAFFAIALVERRPSKSLTSTLYQLALEQLSSTCSECSHSFCGFVTKNFSLFGYKIFVVYHTKQYLFGHLIGIGSDGLLSSFFYKEFSSN